MQINLFENLDASHSLSITVTKSGATLKIKATPKAAKNRIGKVENGALKIYVTDTPEDNKANIAITKLLSKSLDIPISHLEIISGQHNRLKTVCFKNISEDELKASFAKIL